MSNIIVDNLKQTLVNKITNTPCNDEYELLKLFDDCYQDVRTFFSLTNYIQHTNIDTEKKLHKK